MGRRLFEGLGVALVLASLLLLLALLTYTPGDASLDTAVDAPPRNFLGRDGALVADILIQSVGLAAYLVPTVLFGWAFRLMLQRPIRRPVRGIAAAARWRWCSARRPARSCAPGLALPAGAGGAVGWVLLGVAGRAGLAPFALPLAMAAAALVALLLLSIIGLSPGDWRDLGSGAGRRRGPVCPRLGARHGGGDGVRPALHSALARGPARAARGGSRPAGAGRRQPRMAASAPSRLARGDRRCRTGASRSLAGAARRLPGSRQAMPAKPGRRQGR